MKKRYCIVCKIKEIHPRSRTGKCGSCVSSWNKGLTKETDERVRKNAISISKTLKGIKIPESQKKIFSKRRNS